MAGAGLRRALVAAAGLLQRLTVGVGWLWLTLVAAREIRADR